MGVPGIKGVWCHEFAAGCYFNVVSVEQMYTGHPQQVGAVAALTNTHSGRYTIVVEEDIDPSNLEQVMWAVVTRGLPREAIQILDRCPASSTDPAIPVAEKKKYEVLPKPLYSSRVVINGCRPFEDKQDWYPIARVTPELRSRLIATTSTGLMISRVHSRGHTPSSTPTGSDSTTGTSRILRRSATPSACSMPRSALAFLGSSTSASQTPLRIRRCPTSGARQSWRLRSEPRDWPMQS